ncbi:MAG: hypothetical protein A2Z70_02435 [Chloroflexi bacterium RBG_13_48_17]|nr:MAG: hypothetical protein A2Z70_02435 [Chloroflexi bacterium RBG_13_48_17]
MGWTQILSNTKFKEIGVIILLAAFALFLGGYGENTWYLPIINKLNNPNLYPNDLISTFLSGNGNNTSFFYVIVAFITRYIDIAMFSFIGYIITLIFFCLGVFYLARTIFKNSNIAYLAVILLLIPKMGLTGGHTFSAEFVYRDISIDLILFAVIFFLKSRYIFSFLLLGLAFDFHILTALPVLGFFLFDLIFRYWKLDTSHRKQMIISLFVFALVITPMIFFYSGSSSSLFSGSFFSRADPQWLSIMQERASHLLSPRTWTDQISAYAPLLILTIISGIYLVLKKEHLANLKVHKTFLNLFYVFLIYVVIEVIFTEIIPWEPLMVLRILTINSITNIIGIIYISYFLFDIYSNSQNEKMIPKYLNYLLIAGLFASLFLYDFKIAWALIPMALASLAPPNKRPISYILYLVSIGLLIYLADNKQSYGTVIFGFCWFIALIAIDYIKQRKILTLLSRAALIGLTIVMFMVLLFGTLIFSSHLSSGHSLTDSLMERVNIPYITPTTQYKDVQLWAKTHTNISDIFLVPPEAYPGDELIHIGGGFRSYSERPIYGEWGRDGDFGYFNHGLAYEWYSRMNELDIYTSEDLWKYTLLDEKKIKELQKKYDIDYAVFVKPKQLNFPVAYENELFIVYKIM